MIDYQYRSHQTISLKINDFSIEVFFFFMTDSDEDINVDDEEDIRVDDVTEIDVDRDCRKMQKIL